MFRQMMLTFGCALGVSAAGLVNAAYAQDESQEMMATSATAPAGLPASAYGGGPIPIGYQTPMGTMAYGRQWVHTYGTQDWQRFYHYPYVFYPQNFWGSEYYRSSESLYYRYPNEMRIPVYNKQWHNYYPSPRRYHWGHHFHLDVF